MKRDLRIAYSCLAGICIIWGTTFLAMRIGVLDFPPFLFAGLRQFFAGILLTGYLLFVRKMKFPTLGHLGQQAFAGFLMITLGNGLVSWAEVYVPSGVAAIICSFMPVWVTIINITVNRAELPNGLIILGVLTGLGGIILVFHEHLAAFIDTRYQAGIAFVFIASLGWAVGSVIIKRSGQTTNTFLNSGFQMIFGSLGCFLLSLLFDDLSDVRWSTNTVFALGYLILIGSVAAFAMYGYALTKLPITIASLYSYINPLVAVILGWAILDEKLNPNIGMAMVVTVLGIYLVNRGFQLRSKKDLASNTPRA